MFVNLRYERIMELLRLNGAVTVSELMNQFQISIETVRRDLSYLESQNKLKRVHGGAVAVAKMKTFNKLEERISENQEEKRRLSETAASFIQEGDIIAIDSGSTVLEFAKVIQETLKHIRIVTNSLDVFMQLRNDDRLETILIGGHYLKEEAAFYGNLAAETIQNLCFSKLFLSPSAISLKNGIGDYISELAEIQKCFIRQADQVIVMADSSKYEKSAFIKLCDLDPDYLYVTDSAIDPAISNLYRENNIKLYTGRDL